jgi:uncharacterized membrane protein YecN with MAPEG domain
MMITMLYASVLALIGIGLSYPAGSLRGKLGISLGDGGNQELLLAMRRQANFVEYVPMALIVIALLENSGAPAIAIHSLGGGLCLARLAHAQGIKAESMSGAGRVIGAAGTALITVVAAIWAIVMYF